MVWQLPTQRWQPPDSASPLPARRRLARETVGLLVVVVVVFAVLAFGAGFFLIGGEEPAGPPPGTGRTGEPTETPVPVPAGMVAGAWGETVTVTGLNQSGSESATIQVTLSEPEITRELALHTGQAVQPEHDVFVVLEGTLAGVNGIYPYNALHFRLVPRDQVGQWRATRGPHEPTMVGLSPHLSATTISVGNRVVGYLVFDVPESALDDAVIMLRSPLQPEGTAAAYWPLQQR